MEHSHIHYMLNVDAAYECCLLSEAWASRLDLLDTQGMTPSNRWFFPRLWIRCRPHVA